MANMIVIWSGAIVDIPAGWSLCDGNNGTPDLRDCFVGGAGNAYNPGDTIPTNVAPDAGVCLYALAFIMKVP